MENMQDHVKPNQEASSKPNCPMSLLIQESEEDDEEYVENRYGLIQGRHCFLNVPNVKNVLNVVMCLYMNFVGDFIGQNPKRDAHIDFSFY